MLGKLFLRQCSARNIFRLEFQPSLVMTCLILPAQPSICRHCRLFPSQLQFLFWNSIYKENTWLEILLMRGVEGYGGKILIDCWVPCTHFSLPSSFASPLFDNHITCVLPNLCWRNDIFLKNCLKFTHILLALLCTQLSTAENVTDGGTITFCFQFQGAQISKDTGVLNSVHYSTFSSHQLHSGC